MWVLKRLNTEEVYYFLVGQSCTVGRKDTTILINNDPSVSRKHAVFSLSHPESHLNIIERLPVVTLKDIGSKYGTYVNDSQTVGMEIIILKAGDKITFGQCGASFQILYEPIVITTSCIESDEKKHLKRLVLKLGGHVSSEWSENCTHLVMKELKVTIKAICALTSLKPIVTKEYFENLIQQIEGNKNLPNPESYIPDLGEPILDKDSITFHCKKERQVLFQNKTFFCTSPRQYKKLLLAIKLAGGKVILMNVENEIKTSVILHADTCIMQYQSDSSQVFQATPHYITKIEEQLKKNKKRMIPESDIGLAVVYCSIERYCNPDFNIASSLFAPNKLHSQTLSQQDIFVADTQASTARSSMDRSKSNFPSYVSDTLERNKHETSSSGHHDEVMIASSSIGMNSGKRTRNFSESGLPVKQMKLQDVTVKKENSSSEDISQVTIKTEVITPYNNETMLNDDAWNNLACPYPNQQTDQESVSVKKKEECKNTVSLTEPSEIEKHEVEENNRHRSEERSLFGTSINGISSKHSKGLDSVVTTIAAEQVTDENLPSNLLKIEFASLCPKRNVRPREIQRDNNKMGNSVRNFKRFCKVYVTGNKLPVIIGGRDLIVYNKNASKDFNSWANDNPDMNSQENEEPGLFDWDSNKRSR